MQFKRLIECTSVSVFLVIAFASIHSNAQDPILTVEPVVVQQPQPEPVLSQSVPVQQPEIILGQQPEVIIGQPLYQEYGHYYPEFETAPPVQYPGEVIGEVTLPSISDLESAHELAIEKIEKELELLKQQNQELSARNKELKTTLGDSAAKLEETKKSLANSKKEMKDNSEQAGAEAQRLAKEITKNNCLLYTSPSPRDRG